MLPNCLPEHILPASLFKSSSDQRRKGNLHATQRIFWFWGRTRTGGDDAMNVGDPGLKLLLSVVPSFPQLPTEHKNAGRSLLRFAYVELRAAAAVVMGLFCGLPSRCYLTLHGEQSARKQHPEDRRPLMVFISIIHFHSSSSPLARRPSKVQIAPRP